MQEHRLLPLVVLAAAVLPAQAQIGFAGTPVGGVYSDPNTSSVAYGLSDSGLVVGTLRQPGQGERAFVWAAGQTHGIALPDGYLGAGAAAVNNNGQVLLNLAAAQRGVTRAGVWSAAAGLRLLDSGSVAQLNGAAINGSGSVVGHGTPSLALAWGPGGAPLALAAGGDGTESAAHGINNLGQIVGHVQYQAALWSADGQRLALATLPGHTTATSAANAINDRGQAVGVVGVPGASLATLWQNGQVQVIAEGNSAASAINAAGQVLGWQPGCGSWLWSAGNGARCLVTLAPGLAGFEAQAINAAGQMVGRVGQQAMLYTPVGTMRWRGADGASFSDGAAWDSGIGLAPSRFVDLVVAPTSPRGVFVAPGFVEAKSLSVGGAAPVKLVLQAGAQLVVSAPTRLLTGATLIGSGLLVGGLDVAVGGVVRAGDLRVAGGVTNAGQLLGGGRLAAGLDNRGRVDIAAGETLELSPPPQVLVLPGVGVSVVGSADPGQLQHVNSGTIAVSGGTLAVRGVMRNDAGPGIVLQDAHASFVDGLDNAGVLTLSGNVRFDGRLANRDNGLVNLQPLASVRFTGDVAGSGRFATLQTGGGRGDPPATSLLRFEGRLLPGGDGGIGTLTLGDSEISGIVQMELGVGGGKGAGSDHISFSGALALQAGSLLRLSLLTDPRGPAPVAGTLFSLFDYQALPVGRFAGLELPTLAQGLAWDLGTLYSGGSLAVVAVPEPPAALLLLLGAGVLVWRRRRVR